MPVTRIFIAWIVFLSMTIVPAVHADFKIVDVQKCSKGDETRYTVVCDPSSGKCVYVYQIDHTFKYVNHNCGASGYCQNLNKAIENAINCVNN